MGSEMCIRDSCIAVQPLRHGDEVWILVARQSPKDRLQAIIRTVAGVEKLCVRIGTSEAIGLVDDRLHEALQETEFVRVIDGHLVILWDAFSVLWKRPLTCVDPCDGGCTRWFAECSTSVISRNSSQGTKLIVRIRSEEIVTSWIGRRCDGPILRRS